MKGIDTLKDWVGALTELGLMMLALAIVLSLLVGSQMPFFGSVTANIMTWVKDMGSNGLVGLITLVLIFAGVAYLERAPYERQHKTATSPEKSTLNQFAD